MINFFFDWGVMIFCFLVAVFLHLRCSRRFFLFLQNIPQERAGEWHLKMWRHYTGKCYFGFGMLLLLRLKLIAQGYMGWSNALILVLLVLVVWLSMQRGRFRKSEPE